MGLWVCPCLVGGFSRWSVLEVCWQTPCCNPGRNELPLVLSLLPSPFLSFPRSSLSCLHCVSAPLSSTATFWSFLLRLVCWRLMESDEHLSKHYFELFIGESLISTWLRTFLWFYLFFVWNIFLFFHFFLILCVGFYAQIEQPPLPVLREIPWAHGRRGVQALPVLHLKQEASCFEGFDAARLVFKAAPLISHYS